MGHRNHPPTMVIDQRPQGRSEIDWNWINQPPFAAPTRTPAAPSHRPVTERAEYDEIVPGGFCAASSGAA